MQTSEKVHSKTINLPFKFTLGYLMTKFKFYINKKEIKVTKYSFYSFTQN